MHADLLLAFALCVFHLSPPFWKFNLNFQATCNERLGGGLESPWCDAIGVGAHNNVSSNTHQITARIL